ncbi:MAG: pyrroline-5-carboxylate reductase, partial [Propionibacteriaceae bacterium]|nr:pyrroline-5-carboxylate reductase [Propionibacteriaceae bacterium]
MPFALGVIGLGRMAQALIIPLIEQGFIPADEVIAVVGRKDSVATVSA